MEYNRGSSSPRGSAPGEKNNNSRKTLWSRLLSRRAQFALDVVVLALALVVAYLLRFEFQLEATNQERLLAQLPLVVLIQLGALILSGVYAFIWRYIGLAEMSAFVKAAFGSGLVLLIGRLALPGSFQLWRVPLSIILMDTAFAFSGVVVIRVLRRVVYERYEKRQQHREPLKGKAVLLVGAGQAGVLAAKEIRGRGDMDVWIHGFVDDDPEKQGAVLQGKRVLGTTEDLPELCETFDIDHVIITIAQISRTELRRIVEICERIPIRARIIPGLFEILDGRVGITRFRDVEIEDLLGRPPIQLEQEEVGAFVRNKVVLVTGAGGSIGAELVRQIARFEPSLLLLVERAEFALFEIHRELAKDWPKTESVPLIADVCDRDRMVSIFERYSPRVVFHAAAHKHVPLSELNAGETVKSNALGTWTVGEVAATYGTEAMVLISTDKAVRPSSVMGATKRVAELIVQELDGRNATRYVAVRFGNVMGSAGSVIPIFREQIEKGGPVTVTHPEMVRYFMTIPEAAQLVLQAGAMGEGGEIFILDMGDPVKIVDLARDMIVLSGLEPGVDIEIEFTGMRPGEKLFEELQTGTESIAKTRHPKIFIGQISPMRSEEILAALERLRELAATRDGVEIRAYLGDLLSESQFESRTGVTGT